MVLRRSFGRLRDARPSMPGDKSIAPFRYLSYHAKPQPPER